MVLALTVLAPVGGTVMTLQEVPDPVFAGAMVGPGLAVRPDPGRSDALTPVGGRMATLHPHAFVVVEQGRGVLVHLGIDTVGLRGEGFTVLAVAGVDYPARTPAVTWDPGAVEAAGLVAVCPVIALEAQPEEVTPLRAPGARVRAGEPLFTWTLPGGEA